MRTKSGLFVALVLVAALLFEACGQANTDTGSSSNRSPNANVLAEAPKTPKVVRWKYMIIRKVDYTSLEHRDMGLNGAGGDGWELVAVDNDAYYFKKPY